MLESSNYKRKDGRWEARYVKQYDADGKIKYGYLYGTTYSGVRNKLQMAYSLLLNADSKDEHSMITFRQATGEWLQLIRNQVKESTFCKYNNLLKNHILPQLADYRICRLSTEQLNCFIDQQLTSGRLDNKGGLSPKTVSTMVFLLKAILSYAQDNKYGVQCNYNLLGVKTAEKNICCLKPAEQARLTAYLLQDCDNSKAGVLLAMYTGIRIGELCALRWDNIDLKEQVLKVRATAQRLQDNSINCSSRTRLNISIPKSKNALRDIPLPAFLLPVLQQLRPANKNTYFLTNDKHRLVEPRTIANRFKKYLKESEIEEINFHSLRHTFATSCVAAGFELKSLSEILGHATVNFTLNKYVHSNMDLKRKNMDKLDKKFAKLSVMAGISLDFFKACPEKNSLRRQNRGQ